MYNYSSYNQTDYMMPAKNLNYNQLDYTGQNLIAPNCYGQTTMMPPTSGIVSNNNLFNSYDGFIRGNMFTDLYQPYMVGEPFNLTPQNEREALLNKVREYDFAMIDLNLYLDTHPNDAEKIKAYNQYLSMSKQATNEYESKYGPLSQCSETLNSYPWAWLTPPWPWEGR